MLLVLSHGSKWYVAITLCLLSLQTLVFKPQPQPQSHPSQTEINRLKTDLTIANALTDDASRALKHAVARLDTVVEESEAKDNMISELRMRIADTRAAYKSVLRRQVHDNLKRKRAMEVFHELSQLENIPDAIVSPTLQHRMETSDAECKVCFVVEARTVFPCCGSYNVCYGCHNRLVCAKSMCPGCRGNLANVPLCTDVAHVDRAIPQDVVVMCQLTCIDRDVSASVDAFEESVTADVQVEIDRRRAQSGPGDVEQDVIHIDPTPPSSPDHAGIF